jgi:hypothetical protein
MRILLLLFVNLVLLTNTMYSLGKKEIKFRPVNLYIYDTQTKEPVEGIIVKVSNVIYYEKTYSFFGHQIDSDLRKTFYPIEEFKTDKSGYVQIPCYTYNVGKKYYLYGQFIYINIEPLRSDLRNKTEGYSGVSFYDKENLYYYRPVEKYKAVKIESWPNLTNDEKIYKQLVKTKPYLTTIFNGHAYSSELRELRTDFNCNYEEFSIFLERFIEQ